MKYQCKTHGEWDANRVSGCPECVRELRTENESLRRDACRWTRARRCVRMDQFGGYVVHPDDPADFNSVMAQSFEREIDAAIAGKTKEAGKKLDDKGRCCGSKPIDYKTWSRTGERPHKFCHHCCRAYERGTGEQIENWAWHRDDAGRWFCRLSAVSAQAGLP